MRAAVTPVPGGSRSRPCATPIRTGRRHHRRRRGRASAAPTCTCSSASGTTPASPCARATRSAAPWPRSRPGTPGRWSRPDRHGRPGDPVRALPPLPARALPACTRLPRRRLAVPGGLAEQVAVPVRQLHDAGGLTAVDAALTEPFSIAAMALARAELLGDELLLVTGAGPIGLAITVSAAARGHAVLVTDPMPTRRALAVELGAAHAVDPTGPDAADDPRATAGAGPDVAFEASGTAPGLAASLAALGNGGRLVVVGVAAHDSSCRSPASCSTASRWSAPAPGCSQRRCGWSPRSGRPSPASPAALRAR